MCCCIVGLAVEPTDGHSEVLETLGESVCSDSTVTFAVVFGSWVTGEQTSGSDLDVAVKFSDTLSARERFEKRCFLSGELQSESIPFVDVSDIETLPLGVTHDAVNGTLVCGDKKAFERFKKTIESEFRREQTEIRQDHQTIIDRIAEEGLRG